MAVSDRLKTLVDQMPDPDDRGMLTKNIDKDKIEKAAAEILRGGRASIQGLIEMLGEPGSAENVKPHYALHCVLNRALILGDEGARRALCETLAANLAGGLSAYNKAYLCQELQWAGGKEAVPALARLLTNEELCDPAGMALVAIRDGAAEQLAAALPQAQGRCRLVITHSLAALADPRSVTVLAQVLNDPDREVRLATAAGLARIGDARSASLLVSAADQATGWERIKMTQACLLLAERLVARGNRNEANRIYVHLRDTRTDPAERYVRDAAGKALAAAGAA
jgi:hypothetical protein